MSDYARMAIVSKNPDRYMLARILAQLESAKEWADLSEYLDVCESVTAQINAYFDKLDKQPELRNDREFTFREEFMGKEIAKYVTRLETAAKHRDEYKRILADFLMGRTDVEQAERQYAEVTVDFEIWAEKVNRGEA